MKCKKIRKIRNKIFGNIEVFGWVFILYILRPMWNTAFTPITFICWIFNDWTFKQTWNSAFWATIIFTCPELYINNDFEDFVKSHKG